MSYNLGAMNQGDINVEVKECLENLLQNVIYNTETLKRGNSETISQINGDKPEIVKSDIDTNRYEIVNNVERRRLKENSKIFFCCVFWF